MYFDAVLSRDMGVLFNGSPEETKKWLEENETKDTDRVCYGNTLEMVTISDYLDKASS